MSFCAGLTGSRSWASGSRLTDVGRGGSRRRRGRGHRRDSAPRVADVRGVAGGARRGRAPRRTAEALPRARLDNRRRRPGSFEAARRRRASVRGAAAGARRRPRRGRSSSRRRRRGAFVPHVRGRRRRRLKWSSSGSPHDTRGATRHGHRRRLRVVGESFDPERRRDAARPPSGASGVARRASGHEGVRVAPSSCTRATVRANASTICTRKKLVYKMAHRSAVVLPSCRRERFLSTTSL